MRNGVWRGWAVGAATLLVGLAATPVALGDGSWYEIGSSASPVNHVSSADAFFPILAAANGTPYLSWDEADTVNDALVSQARVASLGSSPVESRPWNELLASTGQPAPNDTRFSLNDDPGADATHTHVVVADSTPYAAWIEPNTAGKGQVHVDAWNGTQWQPVGGVSTLNISASDDATNLSMAVVGDQNADHGPFVAWTETVNGVSELYAKRWNGTAWVQLGGVISTAGAQVSELQASNATGGETLVWVETPQGASHSDLQMSDYYENYNGEGPQWVNEPQPTQDPSTDAHSPSLTNVYGHIVLAFSEHTATTDQLQVEERARSGWTSLTGEGLNYNANGRAVEPILTSTSDGYLWLAWSETDPGQNAAQLRTASYDFNSNGPWDETLPPVNHDDSENATNPALVDASVQYSSGPTGPTGPTGPSEAPVVAWTETDAAGHQQVRSAAFGTPPTNTALPSITGTPQNGDQLTCANGSWTAGADGSAQPTRYTDVWERGARTATTNSDPSWTPITGATGSTYTVQTADDGFRVRCRVVATYGVVSAQAVSTSLRTDAGPPTFNDLAYPQVTGTPIVGHTLTCVPGPVVSDASPGWHNNPDFSYEWTNNGTAIDGATGPTYVPTAYRAGAITIPDGDGDHDIACVVRGTNDLGSTVGASVSVHVVDGPPIPVEGGGAPTITVTPDNPASPSSLAETLSCSTGEFLEGGGQYAYQWLRNETPISGATDATYRVTVEDLGRDMSCETTDTNIAGTSQPNESAPTLIPLPTTTGTSSTAGTQNSIADVSIHMEGGGNQVDPTTLFPVTLRYEKALQAYTLQKLNAGIASATTTCQSEQKLHNWPGLNHVPAVNVPFQSEEDRCRVLLGDPTEIAAEPDGGVRWLDGHCQPFPSEAAATGRELCPSLDIQVTPIDPQKPPALTSDELATVGPATPAEILYDLNGDGKTDAICPGSAPVLSTIFNDNSKWHPRVTIIDQDGTVNVGDISFNTGNGSAYGELRASQVRVCMTSEDPPPTPKLPCVTAGQIGSIQITDANLCPIDARQIDPSDFDQLVSPDLKAYLLAASENELSQSGTLTDRARNQPDGGPLRTTYVSWPTAVEPSARLAIRPARGFHAVDATQSIATGSASSQMIAAATASALASLTSENSPASYGVLHLAGVAGRALSNGLFRYTLKNIAGSFIINRAKAALAYDQIYLAEGPGRAPGATGPSDLSGLNQAAAAADSIVPGVTGDTGQALLDGVGLSAAPDSVGNATGLLLIGSDVGGAIPAVHSFTLTGRNLAPTLGLPTDPKAIALGEAHAYSQQLTDDVTAQGKAAAAQALDSVASNLDQMTQDYQKDAKAYGQQLLDRVKNSLDVGPFTFSGDAHIALNPDGTATLTVDASLPGLTGSGAKTDAQGKPILDSDGNPVPMDGSPINGQATFHADQQGHLALRGVHITAPAAFFLGISLKGLDLTYDSDTGFDLKAQILIQALGNAGIDIKNFQLDPNGRFQDLAVDYLAGAGTGIPVFPGVELTQLGFDLNTAKSRFSADVGVSVGSSAGGGCIPLGAVGQVTIQLYQPVEVQGVVSPKIFCLPFGNITFDVKGDGTVSLTGNWGLHASLVDFDLALGAEFGGTASIAPGAFQVYAHGDGDIIGILKGELDAVLSSRGVAACGSIDVTIPVIGDLLSIVTGSRTIHLAAGASEDFSHGVPLTAPQILAGLHLFTGCDIGRYYPLGKPDFSANRAAVGGTGASQQTFRLPADRGPTIISFTGVGHAPRFTLVSPAGQTYHVTQTGTYGSRLAHGAWGSIVDADSKTVVILPKPPGGVWTAELAPGSAQILDVSAAPILPPAAIKAHVTGRGAHRALHYTVVREPGQTIRISEQASGENRQLATIGASARQTLARGTIQYTVGEASSPARRIVAQMFQDGAPRTELLLTRYRTPNPAVGTVERLTVKRSGRRALIRWRPGALDLTYYVRVAYGDGRIVLGITRRPRFFTTAITRKEGLRVSVYATSATGRGSHPATGILTGSMLIGSVHPLAPYKPAKVKSMKPKPVRGARPKQPTTKKHA